MPINITGTIQNASGVGVEGLVVQLAPEAPAPGGEEAINGIGIVQTPVQQLTSPTGTFQVPALPGFRYRLTIESIGYDRVFRAPDADIAFHLLGLAPAIEQAVGFKTCDEPPTDAIKVTVKAASVAIVRERYTSIEVLRSATQAGPYAVEATIDLEAGTEFYDVELAPPVSEWLQARYTGPGGDSAASDAVQADPDPDGLVFSVDELKEQYLFGVSLVDGDGNPYPPRMFRTYIAAAVAWLEKELDIPVTPRDIVNELHDHHGRDYARWGFFKLREWPMLIPTGTDPNKPFGDDNPSPIKIVFQYPSQPSEVEINDNWIVLPEGGETGHLQLVPGQGGIADILLSPGSLLPFWRGGMNRVPGIWRFTYRAGFCAANLPADIKDAIGMKAAIQVFNIAGDLIAGAGIANTSISVPGLSQSVGTTSSATNSGYGARIGQYEKQLKALLPNLKRYYGKASKITVV